MKILDFLQKENIPFKRIGLYKEAFTHSSYANESNVHIPDYERLEFMGDAVLQLFVSEFIFALHPEYKEEEIPTLEEVYQLIKPTDLTINVEMKTGNTFYPGMEDKVLELTKKYDMMDRIIVSSFNHYTIRSMKEKCPELKTGALYADGIINAVDYVADVVRADALHPGWTKIFYPNYLEDCRRRNILVHVWTINNEEDMRRCCEMGLDAIITNYPDVARKVVDEYQLN